MRVVLLRVGVDTGCRPVHAHGPIFPDGTFEYIPIPAPDATYESRTYGNTIGRSGRPLVDYLPSRRVSLANCPMHVDPEFETYTYGSPTAIQRRLATLTEGDMLVFYGGLRPLATGPGPAPPAQLYIFGYFDVACAVRARYYDREQLLPACGANFHVRHAEVFERQRDNLVLVKGKTTSRLLTKAEPISAVGRDKRGWNLFVLSERARQTFGPLTGAGSIQRYAPRWISPDHADRAADFVRGLP